MGNFGGLSQSPGQWFNIGKEHSRAPFLGGIAEGQAKQARRQGLQSSFGQIMGMAGQLLLQKKQMDMMGNSYGQQQQSPYSPTGQAAGTQQQAAPAGQAEVFPQAIDPYKSTSGGF